MTRRRRRAAGWRADICPDCGAIVDDADAVHDAICGAICTPYHGVSGDGCHGCAEAIGTREIPAAARAVIVIGVDVPMGHGGRFFRASVTVPDAEVIPGGTYVISDDVPADRRRFEMRVAGAPLSAAAARGGTVSVRVPARAPALAGWGRWEVVFEGRIDIITETPSGRALEIGGVVTAVPLPF